MSGERVLAGRPDEPVPVPAVVTALAGDRVPEVVWVNELRGATFRIGARYVKWTPAGSALPSLAGEVARLRWAAPHTPVPEVVEHGRDAAGEWMVTAALPGGNAVEPRWKADPRPAVVALGRGLRALHDALPVDDCPFTWSAADRVTSAHRRSAELEPRRWHPSHHGLDVPTALAAVSDTPPIDRAVVCHGDACAPNTLLDPSAAVVGYVDLGSLGLADRWADLAVASWSLAWNYGTGYEAGFFQAYGVRPDPERIAYYRLLWDMDD